MEAQPQRGQAEKEPDDVCWLCLSGAQDLPTEPLIHPCRCPRVAHARCLARWQLHSAGRQEEHYCRFCNTELNDWKDVLTPKGLKPAVPVVSVHYGGVCYRLRVRPGAEGFQQFQRQLQKITGVPMLECMQITFQCRSPDTAQELSFKGISAFDAAIHCAAISAAERLATGVRSGAPRPQGAALSQPQGEQQQQQMATQPSGPAASTSASTSTSSGSPPPVSLPHLQSPAMTVPSSRHSLALPATAPEAVALRPRAASVDASSFSRTESSESIQTGTPDLVNEVQVAGREAGAGPGSSGRAWDTDCLVDPQSRQDGRPGLAGTDAVVGGKSKAVVARRLVEFFRSLVPT